MSTSNIKKLIGTVTAALAFAPYVALAQFGGAMDKLKDTAGDKGAGYAVGDDSGNLLLNQIGAIIKVGIALTGVIFLVLMIYAGYTWMTAQGDQKKVTEAKETITRAVIGLVVIALAYGITAFVFNKLGAPEAAG